MILIPETLIIVPIVGIILWIIGGLLYEKTKDARYINYIGGFVIVFWLIYGLYLGYFHLVPTQGQSYNNLCQPEEQVKGYCPGS
jgi:hypothetical protein